METLDQTFCVRRFVGVEGPPRTKSSSLNAMTVVMAQRSRVVSR